MALTARQMKFCEEYAICGNGTQSYLIAFETENRKTARDNASKLLAKPEIQEYVKEVRKEYISRVGDKAEFLAAQLIDEISWRDEDGKKSPNWAVAINLLQKQCGLQQTKVDAIVSTPNISITIGE